MRRAVGVLCAVLLHAVSAQILISYSNEYEEIGRCEWKSSCSQECGGETIDLVPFVGTVCHFNDSHAECYADEPTDCDSVFQSYLDGNMAKFAKYLKTGWNYGVLTVFNEETGDIMNTLNAVSAVSLDNVFLAFSMRFISSNTNPSYPDTYFTFDNDTDYLTEIAYGVLGTESDGGGDNNDDGVDNDDTVGNSDCNGYVAYNDFCGKGCYSQGQKCGESSSKDNELQCWPDTSNTLRCLNINTLGHLSSCDSNEDCSDNSYCSDAKEYHIPHSRKSKPKSKPKPKAKGKAKPKPHSTSGALCYFECSFWSDETCNESSETLTDSFLKTDPSSGSQATGGLSFANMEASGDSQFVSILLDSIFAVVAIAMVASLVLWIARSASRPTYDSLDTESRHLKPVTLEPLSSSKAHVVVHSNL